MRRREAFKKLGILSFVGMSGMALVSCANDKKERIATAAAIVPENISERDKLIVNRERKSFADPNNPTKGELKHTPDISFGNTDEKGNVLLKITVGQQGIIHPSTEKHWIDYIKVYVNDREMVSVTYANGGVRGFGDFYLALNKGDNITVEAACNLHGIWENSVRY